MARKLSTRSWVTKFRVQSLTFTRSLGPFHKESVYQNALSRELEGRGLKFEREKSIPVKYQGKTVGTYRPDFIIDGKILVELKAQKSIPRANEKQLFYYLAGTGYKLGLLVNFGQAGRVYIKRWVAKS